MNRLIERLRHLFDTRIRGQSAEVKRSARNATYSTTDHLLLPILLIIATPILVAKLGTDKYGIWTLANTFVGLSSLLAFGLGAATIKYVSKYRALNDEAGVVRVIRSTLTMYTLSGIVAGVLAYFSAPLLVESMFKVQTENESLAVLALQIGAFGIIIRFIDGVFMAGIQGFERYDLSAKVSMVVNVVTVLANLALVLLGYGVAEMLIATIVVMLCGGTVKAVLLKRLLVPSLVIAPLIDGAALKEILSYGVYSWIQSISNLLQSQADRLIVVSLLGTTELTYYVVCLQLATQIHLVLARATSFVFPLASAVKEQGDTKRLRSMYFKGMQFTTVLGIAIGLPIFMLSNSILTLWMGTAFAAESAELLRILAFSFTLLVTSIVPYYYLNGTGFVRLNAGFTFMSGLVVAGSAFLLIPWLGVVGAAWARAANTPIDVVSRTILHYRVLDDKRWYGGLLIFLPVFAVFAAGWSLLNLWGEPSVNLFGLAGLGVLYALIGLTLGYFAVRILPQSRASLD